MKQKSGYIECFIHEIQWTERDEKLTNSKAVRGGEETFQVQSEYSCVINPWKKMK